MDVYIVLVFFVDFSWERDYELVIFSYLLDRNINRMNGVVGIFLCLV